MSDFVEIGLSGGGDAITLSGTADGEFFHLPGSTGLGAVTTSTRFRSGAMPGAVHMGSRIEARSVLLKVGVLGAGRRELEELWARLVEVCRADDLTVTAKYPDETVYQLGAVYESGLEGDCSASATRRADGWFSQADLALTAPDPFWRRSTVESFSVEVDDSAPAFLDALARLRLSRSQAIADTTITNSGAVPSPVSWRFIGPADAGTSVSIGGRGFTIDRALGVGDVVEVTPRWGRTPLVTLNGTVDFTVLGVAPRFPELEPGVNAVALSMPGAVAGVWEPSGDVEAVNVAVNPSLRTTADGLTQDGATFTLTTGDPGQLAFTAETDVTCAVFYELTSWDEQWISTRWEASGDGVHAVLEFWAGDRLKESHWSDTVSGGWLSFGGVAIPEGTTKVRVGVGWHGQSGVLQRNQVIFQQASYAFFDGSSGDAFSWEGTADASASVKHIMVKVGGSKVEATWHPSKEVVF